MGIIYFDICSIPLFLIILFVCYSRKMTRGAANQLFILLVLFSLFSAIADLGMEICDNMVPLNGAGVVICTTSTYLYLVTRNSTNVVLLLFLLVLTRTTFLIKKKWAKIAYFFPYGCILAMLIQNPFTHTAFTVTSEVGYARAPLMFAFAIVMAFVLGGSLATTFVIVVPVMGVGLVIIGKLAMPAFRAVFKKYDKLNESIEENVRGMRVVKGFAREEYEKEKFGKASQNIRFDFTKAEKIVGLNSPLMEMCMFFNVNKF